MKNNKQLSINLIAQTVAFFVNFGINFFLTPYIVEEVGLEAYGFVSLGNNFVNYAYLLSIALNSMASRFITICIHQDNYKEARQYYTSVILSNVILAVLLSVPSIYIVMNLKSIVFISNDIYYDVQCLWALLFFNFLMDIVTSTFGVALFASNRIDIQARRDIFSYIIKASILVVVYLIFPAKVWYIGFGSVVSTIFIAFYNIKKRKKLMPDLRVESNSFCFGKVKELFSSGIWNSISRVGSIALTELDLLLSNLFVSSEAMGTLSVAKMVPGYVSNLVSTIITAFMPQLTISYATDDSKEFIKNIKSYMRLILFFQSVLYGGLFGFGDVFFKLWLPEGTRDIQYIYLLSMISISGCFVSSVSYIMTNIFTVTNKLRFSSVVVIGTGFVSFGLTYIVLKTTDLGLIAIAGVSVILVVLRNVVLFLPYGAKCVGAPWYTFFPDLLLNIADVIVAIIICIFLKKILIIKYTWINFFIVAVIAATVVLIINFFVILRKEERYYFISAVQRKFERRR